MKGYEHTFDILALKSQKVAETEGVNTFVHSSAVQQALIEARKRACVRVYMGGERLFGNMWAW